GPTIENGGANVIPLRACLPGPCCPVRGVGNRCRGARDWYRVGIGLAKLRWLQRAFRPRGLKECVRRKALLEKPSHLFGMEETREIVGDLLPREIAQLQKQRGELAEKDVLVGRWGQAVLAVQHCPNLVHYRGVEQPPILRKAPARFVDSPINGRVKQRA